MAQRRTIVSIALGALSVACAAGALTSEPAQAPALEFEPLAEGEGSVIVGRVVNHETGEPTGNAVILIQCECLKGGAREAQTNAQGLYTFRDLPAGKYTVEAYFGSGGALRYLDLPQAARVRVSFKLSDEPRVVT